MTEVALAWIAEDLLLAELALTPQVLRVARSGCTLSAATMGELLVLLGQRLDRRNLAPGTPFRIFAKLR
jgi:hypothetical protein